MTGSNDNLVVRDMTVDANWPNLSQSPTNGKCKVLSVAMYSRGNATVENVRSINTYGDLRSGNECFSIFLSHVPAFDETVPLNPSGGGSSAIGTSDAGNTGDPQLHRGTRMGRLCRGNDVLLAAHGGHAQ